MLGFRSVLASLVVRQRLRMRPQRLNCRALRRSHRGQHCRNLAPTRRKSQRTWTCRRFLIHRVVRRRMFQIPGVMPIAQWLCPYWNGTVERPRSIEWNRGQTHSAVVMPVARAEGVGLLWDLRCLSFCPLSMVCWNALQVHGCSCGFGILVPEKLCTFF